MPNAIMIGEDVNEFGDVHQMFKIEKENDISWAIQIDCCGFITTKEFEKFRDMMNAWDRLLGIPSSYKG